MEEKQRRLKNDILAFARRYFSPDEIEMLTQIADPELRRQELIKLWTLKVSNSIQCYYCCCIAIFFVIVYLLLKFSALINQCKKKIQNYFV